MKHILTLILSFYSLVSYGQDLPCAPPVGQPPTDIGFFRTAITDTQVIRLPVVFTVLYNTDAQNASITDAMLHSQIEVMTRDFRATNADRNQVTPPFSNIIGDCRFEFCLKQIRRVRTNTVNFPDFISNFTESQGGIACLDPLHNVNIYFTNIQYAGGQSIFPNAGIVGQYYDGNIIRIQSFLAGATRTNTHELGHWFGLPHTFQGGCNPPGDGIDDTPPTTAASGCNPSFAPCGGQQANVHNHLDYSDCRRMFTNGQCFKMRSIAFTLRSALLQTQCSGTTPDNPPVITITSPLNNQTFTAGSSISISANATDDKGITKVEFYNGATLLNTDFSLPYGYLYPNVPVGNYTISTRAYDAIQSTVASVNIFVNSTNNTPPVVSVSCPTGTQFTAPASFRIVANATDNGFISKVEFSLNGSAYVYPDVTVPYELYLGGVGSGTWRFTARAYDNLGLTATSTTLTITVTTGTVKEPILEQYMESGKLKVRTAQNTYSFTPQ